MEEKTIIKKRYFNVTEVSQYTGIATSTIYEWAANGILPSIKIGRRVIFDLQDIDIHLGKLKRESNLIEQMVNEVAYGSR